MGSVEAKPGTVSVATPHLGAEGNASFSDSMKELYASSGHVVASSKSQVEDFTAKDELQEDQPSALAAAVSDGAGSAVERSTVLVAKGATAKASVNPFAVPMADNLKHGIVGSNLHAGATTVPTAVVAIKGKAMGSKGVAHRAKETAAGVATPEAEGCAKVDVVGLASKKSVAVVPLLAEASSRISEPSAGKLDKGGVVAAVPADGEVAGTTLATTKGVLADVGVVAGTQGVAVLQNIGTQAAPATVAVAGPGCVVPIVSSTGAGTPIVIPVHGGHGPGTTMPVRHEGEVSELTLQSYDAATPNKLEVGLQGGAMGWLKVRAEYGQNGEVNTFLRGASVSTTAMLQTQAPGIATYLGTQDVVVKSVQVEAAGGLSAGVTADAGSGGAGGFTHQEKQRNKESGYDGALEVSARRGADERMGGVDVLPGMYAMQTAGSLVGTGGWVNVRA